MPICRIRPSTTLKPPKACPLNHQLDLLTLPNTNTPTRLQHTPKSNKSNNSCRSQGGSRCHQRSRKSALKLPCLSHHLHTPSRTTSKAHHYPNRNRYPRLQNRTVYLLRLTIVGQCWLNIGAAAIPLKYPALKPVRSPKWAFAHNPLMSHPYQGRKSMGTHRLNRYPYNNCPTCPKELRQHLQSQAYLLRHGQTACKQKQNVPD